MPAPKDDVTDIEAREALLQLDPLWYEFLTAAQMRIVQLLVKRVDVRRTVVLPRSTGHLGGLMGATELAGRAHSQP